MGETLRDFTRRLAKAAGIIPLRPGEARPHGYYMGDHYTGESRIPRNAVINVAQPDTEVQPFAISDPD